MKRNSYGALINHGICKSKREPNDKLNYFKRLKEKNYKNNDKKANTNKIGCTRWSTAHEFQAGGDC